jgi:glycosyltransferase involved in cell wall biosynthesis/peptidoglycan/xylan/chitin deacetylase (PgdA/CDA1 family)
MFVTTSWDDGHVLDLKVAELLHRYGVAGTFYVSPQDREFESRERLTDDQITALAKDFEIGAHTMTHPRLPKVDDVTAYREMAESRAYLRRLSGQTVTSFCYPGGAFRRRHRAMAAQLGFTYARTVRRFWFGRPSHALTADTSVHAYQHWSDAWQIARFARFNPVQWWRYLRSWDELAIAMFERAKVQGGVFHLWGHSWEIERNGDWRRLERVLAHISGDDEAAYVQNQELGSSDEPSILITAPYFAPHFGGLESFALNLALKLQNRHGWRVAVATTTEPGQKPGIYTVEGLKVYRLKPTFRLGNTNWNPRWVHQLRRIVRTEQPDIIQTNAPVPGMVEATMLAAGRRPVVLTWHTGSMKKGQPLFDVLAVVYEAVVLPFLCRRANQLTCSSESVRTTILKRRRDVTVITPGVDTERFSPAAQLPKNTVLFVANALNRSDQYKGLGRLIESMAWVTRELPEAKLIVVGDGNMRAEYEQQAKAAGIHATFTGSQSGEALVKSFQSATLFVLPTTNDSYPTVILEAMAAGLPVVSFRTGSIPDMIEDGATGRIVANTQQALREAILDYLKDYDLAKTQGAAARLRADTQASWRARVDAMAELMERALQPKIVQVAPYYPPHVGGMENVVQELTGGLREHGRNVEVLTSRLGSGAGTAAEAKFDDAAYVRRLATIEVLNTPIMPGLFGQIVRQPRGSIVHMHVAQALAPEATLLAAKLRGFPVVAHVHLDVEASSRIGEVIFGPYKRLFLARVLRACDRVVVLSEAQRELMIRLYRLDPWRVVVVPNGVAERFFMQARTRPHAPLRLLNVGRLAVQKRPERMVEAAAWLGEQVQLDMVGDGELRAELEAKARELGARNVTFHGFKYGEELLSFYRRADAYMLSSDKEGLPLVLLEAMSAGLPVIGSDVLGIREHLAGVGVLVPDPSPETFAAAIKNFIAGGSETYARLSQLSRRAAEGHSWELVTHTLQSLYHEATQ